MGKSKENSDNLEAILSTLGRVATGDEVKAGAVIKALDSLGFGPLLVTFALLVISPIGGVPGACAVLGGMIFLISAQIIAGRKRPWFPKWLKKIKISSKKFRTGLIKIKLYAKNIDWLFQGRFSFIADNDFLRRVAAGIMLALSIGIIGLSLIPFAPAALAVPVLLFGLGLSVHDGLVTLLGFGVLFLPSLLFLP